MTVTFSAVVLKDEKRRRIEDFLVVSEEMVDSDDVGTNGHGNGEDGAHAHPEEEVGGRGAGMGRSVSWGIDDGGDEQWLEEAVGRVDAGDESQHWCPAAEGEEEWDAEDEDGKDGLGCGGEWGRVGGDPDQCPIIDEENVFRSDPSKVPLASPPTSTP